jgi:hypothetical protein
MKLPEYSHMKATPPMPDHDDITTMKKHLHALETQGRTPAWEYLVHVYESDPTRGDVAILCLHQMFTYLDELEGDPRWSTPERENEYEEYFAFAQRILEGYRTIYADSAQFQWELCYYVMCYPTFHWLTGTIHIHHQGDELVIRSDMIRQFQLRHPESMLFKYIDPIQSFEKDLVNAIQAEDLPKLRAEIESWNLQDNFADQEVADFFTPLLQMT